MSKTFRWLSLGVSCAMLVTLVLINAIPAPGAPNGSAPVVVTNTSANPVPVSQTGTWSVGITGTPNVNVANPSIAIRGNVGAFPVSPPDAFSVVTSDESQLVLVGPDHGGYAISSVTFSNETGPATIASLAGAFGVLTADCAIAGDNGIVVDGPRAVVPTGGTVHLDFPQPFILEPGVGPDSCLVNFGGTNVTVVGYRLPS